MSDLDKVKIGDEEISLADLAGFDMSGVDAARFSVLPEGFFQFEVLSDPLPDLKEIESKGVKKAVVEIPCKVLNVYALKNNSDAPDGDATKLIGREHKEGNLLNTTDSLKYLMATLEDLKATPGPLRPMLHGLAGTRFDAHVKHRTDPNDTDKIYAGLRKIVNVVKPTGSELAGQVAAA